MMRLLRVGALQLWAIVLLFLAWESWVVWQGLNAIVMPRPSAVVADLVTNPGVYVRPALMTVGSALFGLVIGMLAGSALAVAGWSSRLLQGSLTPVTVIFSSVPVVTIIPILARIFGYDHATTLAVVVVISFFPAFVFATAGLRSLPPLSNDLFNVLGARKTTLLWRLALPSAVPSLCVALRIAAAHSVLAAIVAEYLMGTGGLGTLFAETRSDFKMDRALGASLVAIALSILLYALAQRVEAWVRQRWN